jgi:hypothetical protein
MTGECGSSPVRRQLSVHLSERLWGSIRIHMERLLGGGCASRVYRPGSTVKTFTFGAEVSARDYDSRTRLRAVELHKVDKLYYLYMSVQLA